MVLQRPLSAKATEAGSSCYDATKVGRTRIRFHVREGRRCGLHGAAQSIATGGTGLARSMFKCRKFHRLEYHHGAPSKRPRLLCDLILMPGESAKAMQPISEATLFSERTGYCNYN